MLAATVRVKWTTDFEDALQCRFWKTPHEASGIEIRQTIFWIQLPGSAFPTRDFTSGFAGTFVIKSYEP